MAADIEISGVPSKIVWEYVRDLGFGGAGYYQGRNLHVDVGPARFWDEKTSGVGSGKSDDNKLMGIVSDLDIYKPGEPLRLRFIRMTAFPISASVEFSLEQKEKTGEFKKIISFIPSWNKKFEGQCISMSKVEDTLQLKWQLPAKIKEGRYRISASFCKNPYEDMPEFVHTPEFEVVR
jgi:hypothetical protein